MTTIRIVNISTDPQTIMYYEGACNRDGSFKKGWQPPGQWYVRQEGPGDYVVIHNLNTIKYATSASPLEGGETRISEVTDVSFRIKTYFDDIPQSGPFRFFVSVQLDG